MKKINLAIAVLLLTSASANAATHVVDNQNPIAADTNPGSEQKPWKTVQHAADQAQPGDTIYICEGTYPESVTLKHQGTEKNWITFQSAPRRTAQLIGLSCGNAQFTRIQGFRFVNQDKKAKGGIRITSADNIDIIDNFIENAGTGIVGGRTLLADTKTHSPSNIRILHNEIYHVQFGINIAGNHWLLEGNEIHRLFDYGLADDDDYTRAFGEDHEYRYNFFHGSSTKEIGKSHVDIVQFFDNNGEYLKNLNIHENVFTDFHQGLMGEMHHPGNGSNLTFKQNIYYTAEPWGAWGLDDEEIPNVTAERNTYYGIQWFGVGIKGAEATGGIIRNNIFDKIDQAVQITKNKKKNDTLIEDNILFQINHKDRDLGKTDKVDVDPKFVDPAHADFRLQKDSPAIHAGFEKQTIGALDYPNTYVVDPFHPAATDDSFGYPGRPFKTLAKAMAVAQPGETILLRPGIYRELLKPTQDNLTIIADTNTVTISGADLIEYWKKDADGWYTTLPAKPTQLLLDGKPFQNFNYNAAEKRLDFNTSVFDETFHGDPRIHVFESLTRQSAIDLTATHHTKTINLRAANTLGPPILDGTHNTPIFTPPATPN